MITPITATFPALNFPKEVDYPTQEDWAAFSAAAELNYGILSGTWSDKSEEFKAQTNNLALEIQSIGENAFNAISVNTIEDLATYTGTGLVMVKDINRGGTFIYDSNEVANDNQGTNFNGWIRQYSGEVNVMWFGAVGDGTSDDTLAFQNAAAVGKNISIPGGKTYIVSDTIDITTNTTVIAYGAVISWVGMNTTPLFRLTAPAENIFIKGGTYIGESSAWLQSVGVTFNPTSIADYARYIVEDIRVSGALIFIDAQKAARFKVSRVITYTANGINAFGKIVEIKVSDSVIFGSTGDLGTYGIKAEAYTGAASNSYPEGFHITNSTIDNFDRTFSLIDIFVATVTNCYIGKILNGTVPIYIKRGNTTHCREITFNGNTINGGILFDTSTAGVKYFANIVDNTFTNCDIYSIQLKGNTYQVKIDGNRFESPTGTGSTFAVFAENNVGNIDVINNTVSSNYTRLFSSSGTIGESINVCNNYGDLTTAVYGSRPVNSRNNCTEDASQNVRLTGSPTAGVSFTGTITNNFAKGEKYLLVININYTSTASGILLPSLPTGVSIPGGSGWSSQYIYIDATSSSRRLSITFPVYVSVDAASGVVGISNYNVGSAVNTGTHSSMSLIRI